MIKMLALVGGACELITDYKSLEKPNSAVTKFISYHNLIFDMMCVKVSHHAKDMWHACTFKL